jgi:hypothetical protein
MQADTKPDVSALEALDFDIICESAYGCDRAASWIHYVDHSCGCHQAGPRCDKHRKQWIEKRVYVDRTGRWVCHLCGTDPITFTTDRWEPLHGH